MSSPLGIPGIRQPDEIGRGAFGTVYRADDDESGRAVAVKIIQDRVTDAEQRRAFALTCRAVSGLAGHPHIVPVHRGGTTDLDEPYLVMDLMTAGTLADRLDREGPLPWPEVLDIGVALAGALETAHRAGVLHLAVTPTNVLLTERGDPQLSDFGVSGMPGVTTTADERIRPGLAYVAPERLLDGIATAAADLYGLGALMYTLLAGDPPFGTKPEEDPLVAIARIVRQPAPDLRGEGVPELVVRVVDRLLAKSPVDRYASAAAAALALQAAQRAAGGPVTQIAVSGRATRGPAWARSTPHPGGGAPDDRDPPLTRPRYVPRSHPGRGAADDLVAAIPAPRSPGAAGPITGPIPVVRPSIARGSAPDALTGPIPIGPRPQPVADTGPNPRPELGSAGRLGRPALPRPARRPLALATAATATAGVVAALVLLQAGPPPGRAAAPSARPPLTAAAAPTPAPTPAPTTAPSPTPSTAPAPQLAVAGDVAHPDRDAVAARLDGYFRAINEEDLDAAFRYYSPDSTVTANGLAAFRRANTGIAVQRARIVAIDDLAGGQLRVTVTFRSTRDAGSGTTGASCADWRRSYELTGPDGLIRQAAPLTDPRRC